MNTLGDTQNERLPIDWDAPGTLSIVVQGGLFAYNIVETANHVSHWRALFPHAQIIVAVSTTDLLASDNAEPMALFATHRTNGLLRAALRQIKAASDLIKVSEGAMPLPPLKRDNHGANNINLQIAAAQCGLRAATGRYVLRVRSDLVFLDRQFLDQYAQGCRFPRGDSAVFTHRLLVSWLYTLNPYTVERMPFHVSDWFHFGLADDVRRFWDVPTMTFADASYHKVNGFPDHANHLERLIVPRLAVEQHLTFASLAAALPDLELASCVDWRSRDRSVDALVDNFVLCDLVEARCVFDKYAFDFTSPIRRRHCITSGDWLQMAALSGPARRDVLEGKAEQHARRESRPFPRTWSADALQTKQGLRTRGAIAAMSAGGVLIHGPYDRVPLGRYLATLNTAICQGPGVVTLRITLGEGLRVLAERRLTLMPGEEQQLVLPFDLLSGIGDDLELIAEVEGNPELAVAGLTIAERPSAGFQELTRFDATARPMQWRFGEVGPSGLATVGQEGHLLFGPLIALPAGSYRVCFVLADVAEPGGAKAEVAIGLPNGPEQHLVAVEDIPRGAGSTVRECTFDLENQTSRVEFRVWVTARSMLTVKEIILERM